MKADFHSLHEKYFERGQALWVKHRILLRKYFLSRPVLTSQERKKTVWDGNVMTVPHRAWIVSEQDVTKLATKPSFLWWRIWLGCYHL